MARTRIEVRCECWEDVDRVLANIGEIDIRMMAAEHAAKNRIMSVQAGLENVLNPLAAQRKELEMQVYSFMQAHRGDFGKKKSKKLTFGKVDWRTHPAKIVQRKGWSLEAIVQKIKDVFANTWKEYVVVKATLDKTKLRGLSDESLAQVGLEKKQDVDQPGLSVDYEKVKEALRR